MALYSKVEYWDERYRKSLHECSEWYQGYRSLRHLFNPSSFVAAGKGNAAGRPHQGGIARSEGGASPRGAVADGNTAMQTIPEQQSVSSAASAQFPPLYDARVLILGCGNGCFAEDMRHDGWTGRMVNLDFSSVVIEQQQEKYRHFSPKLEFVCHDICKGLPFADGSFDLIISKASFDAILCGPSPDGHARRLIQEVVRCLAPGHGIFFLVTTGNPDSRLLYLEHRENNDLYHYWDNVRHHAVHRAVMAKGKAKVDYVYISRKRADASDSVAGVVELSCSSDETESSDIRSVSKKQM